MLKKKSSYVVAVAGATGVVGKEMIDILEERNFPVSELVPLAIDTTGKDDVYVGRIREDESIPNGINLWVVSDNLRKGAALNAVQIAEYLIK